MQISKLPSNRVFVALLLALLGLQLLFVSCVSSSLRQTTRQWKAAADGLREDGDQLGRQLRTVQQQLDGLQNQLAAITSQRKPSAAFLASSVVPIGIRWTENDSTHRFTWKGTGFGLEGTPLLVTAAHVLEQASTELRDFVKRDLQAEIVIRLQTGEIVKVENYAYHPEYPTGRADRHRPAIDVGTFRVAEDTAITRLPLAKNFTSEITDKVLIGGFPNAVSQVQYSTATEDGFQPTIRVGRIERLVDISDLATSHSHSLIQFGIPIVGGFSGSPVLNMRGEVIAVATFSSHRVLQCQELRPTDELVQISSTTRILDPAHVSFAISKRFIEEMLDIAGDE